MSILHINVRFDVLIVVLRIVVLILLPLGCTPLVQTSPGASKSPQLQETQYVTTDGSLLPLRSWLPNEDPQVIVVAVHGYSEYSKSFELVATYLNTQGIAVYAYDQRGFGETKYHGVWPGINLLKDDLRKIVVLLKEKYPRKPLYVLGLSMGAAVITSAFADKVAPKIDGLILAAPAVWGGDTFNNFYRVVLWLTVRTLPWLKVSGRGFGIKLSDNQQAVDALQSDKLVIAKSRIDAIYGLVQLMDETHINAKDLNQNLLVLYGLKDEVIPLKSACRFFSELPENHTTILYQDGYHLLLRDKKRMRVWRDIVEWIRTDQFSTDSNVQELCN